MKIAGIRWRPKMPNTPAHPIGLAKAAQRATRPVDLAIGRLGVGGMMVV